MILLTVETLYILAVLRTLHLIPAVHLVQCSERQKDRASQISFNGRTVAFLQSCCTISNVPPMKRPRGLSFFVSHRLISPPAPDLLAERKEGLEATSGHCCSAIHGRRIVVCPSEATAGEATSPPRNGTLAGHTCSGHPIIFFSPTKEFFIFFGKAFALCPQFIELILSFSLSRVWKRYFGKV